MLDPWPLVFGHCWLSCLLLCQAELQRSCSQHSIHKGAEGCQLLCSCSMYPPVPPPPPPPPPPRALTAAAPEASAPLPRPWWMEIIVLGMIGSALAVFLLLTVIICYKAIRRKPKKMEKNGTNCGEDAMSSFKKTNTATVGTRSV
ncbi:proline-rich membrane anchor 1-like [Sinocyclocheilus anshuiensis]|uniref:proline-rich membrane anchor 1-like n=1 Tax=Sinocyclocheilus anshuiensis TaxID=1608454 RepID=UPI0007B7DD17|nr:PREDICTED: proline-rich membrane anchor 1-like [Sinocyclocheilus anshuiensis]